MGKKRDKLKNRNGTGPQHTTRWAVSSPQDLSKSICLALFSVETSSSGEALLIACLNWPLHPIACPLMVLWSYHVTMGQVTMSHIIHCLGFIFLHSEQFIIYQRLLVMSVSRRGWRLCLFIVLSLITLITSCTGHSAVISGLLVLSGSSVSCQREDTGSIPGPGRVHVPWD